MQKIIPHLWYDKEAKEAVEFYTSLFPESKITHTIRLCDTPGGDSQIVGFELWGQELMAISAGPYFKFNPSISFIVNFDPLLFKPAPDSEKAAREKIDEAWKKLSDGGRALMEIGAYPFSKRYGWIVDRYGLSWQLMLTDPAGEPRPPIIPALMFVKEKCGLAEEAMKFYLSVFKNSKQGSVIRYPAGMAPDKEGTIMFEDFQLEGHWFAAMDSAHEHKHSFNEAISFMVNCADQQELDYYWERLSAVKEAEQCGWLKDKYGLSWQITSEEMEEMMKKGTQEQIDRLTKSFLPMKKLDIAQLRAAYIGK